MHVSIAVCLVPNHFAQFMIRVFGTHKDKVRSPYIILSDEMVYEERFAVSIQNR